MSSRANASQRVCVLVMRGDSSKQFGRRFTGFRDTKDRNITTKDTKGHEGKHDASAGPIVRRGDFVVLVAENLFSWINISKFNTGLWQCMLTTEIIRIRSLELISD